MRRAAGEQGAGLLGAKRGPPQRGGRPQPARAEPRQRNWVAGQARHRRQHVLEEVVHVLHHRPMQPLPRPAVRAEPRGRLFQRARQYRRAAVERVRHLVRRAQPAHPVVLQPQRAEGRAGGPEGVAGGAEVDQRGVVKLLC